MLIAALKDQKGSHNNMKENRHFKKSLLNYINNQKQQQQQQKIKLVMVSNGVDVVAKTKEVLYKKE